MNKFLFYPEKDHIFTEIFPFIEYIIKNSNSKVFILSNGINKKLIKKYLCRFNKKELSRLNIFWMYEKVSHLEKLNLKIENFIYKKFDNKSDLILNNFFFVITMGLIESINLYRKRLIARKIINKIKPNVLSFTRDRHIGISFALILEAKKRKCFTCLIPWGYVNTAYSIVNRKNDKRNILGIRETSILQKIQNINKSTHIFKFGGITYSFLKPYKTLACWLTGMTPSNPWYFGSDVDICFVDSKNTKSILSVNGVESKNIIVTGNQIHDQLFKKNTQVKILRNNIINKYNFNPDNQIAIVALPHLAEHGVMNWNEHWENIFYILGNLKKKYQNLLVSLHPRCNIEIYQKKLIDLRLKIIDERLIEIIPTADIFFNGWSGVTLWGPLLNIPTVVFDWFPISNMGYEYLFEIISRIENKEDLVEFLRNYQTKEKLVRQKDPKLPIFNGNASKNIFNEIISRV